MSSLTCQIAVILILEYVTTLNVNAQVPVVQEALLGAYSKIRASGILTKINAHFINHPSLYTEAQYMTFILENRLGMCLHLYFKKFIFTLSYHHRRKGVIL